MPSFDSINYATRPNKMVERKIIFSGLSELSRKIDLSNHHYYGLGSLWFTDFVIAHKFLGIQTLKSIERPGVGANRARFNKPFACIDVVEGETSKVLPVLPLDIAPSLFWLDYDSGIDGPVLDDINLLIERCLPNSIIIVTINAHKGSLPLKDENDESISVEQSLRRIAGDLVPTPLPTRSLQTANYPKLLCEIISNQLFGRFSSSGRSGEMFKLFDLSYADGAPMVTFGVILASPDISTAVRELVHDPRWEGVVDAPIRVPPLTVKEKIALDQLLPSAHPLTPEDISRIGFDLLREQIHAYSKYYRYYPIFGELAV